MTYNISVAAPVYNEAQGIEQVVRHWHHYLSQSSLIAQFEIVLCNDGSTDETALILNQLSAEYPSLRVMHLTKNKGAAFALFNAISETKGDYVFLQDADDQFPIENLSLMLKALEQKKVEAVLGSRKKQDGFFLRAGSYVSGLLCNWAHRQKIADFNSICRLIKGDLLRKWSFETKSMNYSTEITSKLLEYRLSFCEIDIVHRQRQFGQSKIRLMRNSWHRLLYVFYLCLRQSLVRQGVLRVNDEEK